MSDAPDCLRPVSCKDLLDEPHSHAIRYFERSSNRVDSDESACGSSFDVAALEGPRSVGLEVAMNVVARDVSFRIYVGLQFGFEKDLELSREVYADFLVENVLPALMPILTTWTLGEIQTMQPSGYVEVPFTEVYPVLGESIRSKIMSRKAGAVLSAD